MSEPLKVSFWTYLLLRPYQSMLQVSAEGVIDTVKLYLKILVFRLLYLGLSCTKYQILSLSMPGKATGNVKSEPRLTLTSITSPTLQKNNRKLYLHGLCEYFRSSF